MSRSSIVSGSSSALDSFVEKKVIYNDPPIRGVGKVDVGPGGDYKELYVTSTDMIRSEGCATLI